MSCIALPQSNLIKGTKIVKSATQKIISVAYAIPGDPNTALETLGIASGDPNFDDPNCLATNFEVDSFLGQSSDTCSVVVSYVGYDYYGSPTTDDDGNLLSYSYNEALNQDQTNFNIANNNVALIVYYWQDPALIGQKNNQTAQSGATIPVLKPYSTKIVRFFYVSDGFPDDFISGLTAYVGYYNTDTWDGGAPKTWSCTGVTANPVGLAQQLLIECSFYYKPETWLQWAFFKDPGNGGSPIGAHKNLADPNQTVANVGFNGAAGFLPYNGISFIASFGFE